MRLSSGRVAAAGCALGLVVLLRLVPTVFVPSLDWGDEVYQVTEPAHRLVFGTGLVTWEFAGHIRSWLLPGMAAGIMAAGRIASFGPGFYGPAIAAACAALSLVPVVGTFLWCRRRFGGWAALAGAAVAGLAPEMVYFGGRTLAEVVAGHVLVGAVFLSQPGGHARAGRRAATAGVLLGLALALRPQVLPAAVVLLVWPGMAERWRVAAGAAAALAAASVLDWVTLGAPSASIWRYVAANLAGASDSFGTQPWYYFLLAEAAVWGVALPVPVVLCVIGARRWAMPLVAALALIGAHMAIGHKEHRFIYPALALCAVEAGIGLAVVVAWVARRLAARGVAMPARAASLGVIAGWAALCGMVWAGPGMVTLRARARDTLAAADYAAGVPEVCGIGMGPGKDAWVAYGGYTHLHRDVPLFWPRDKAAFGREAAGFDLLLSEERAPGYTVLRCFGTVCVSRRDGPCASVPADPMPAAPGAHG